MRSFVLLALLTLTGAGAARAADTPAADTPAADTFAAVAPECAGCEAYIELADQGSQELLALLPIIESVPLAGGIVHWRPDAGYTTLRVATDPDYAAANGLSSFDVASTVLRLVKAHPGWDVQWISARLEPRPAAARNAGSIGHRP